MKAKKILFITQEMIPFVPESPKAVFGKNLPKSIQESNCEIRTFTPKWGISMKGETSFMKLYASLE